MPATVRVSVLLSRAWPAPTGERVAGVARSYTRPRLRSSSFR
jgi:hypothetical protein